MCKFSQNVVTQTQHGSNTCLTLVFYSQNELTDLFTDLVMTTHGMKSFTPSTKSHEIILSNIIRVTISIAVHKLI